MWRKYVERRDRANLGVPGADVQGSPARRGGCGAGPGRGDMGSGTVITTDTGVTTSPPATTARAPQLEEGYSNRRTQVLAWSRRELPPLPWDPLSWSGGAW